MDARPQKPVEDGDEKARLQRQMEEIERILKATGLSIEELADRAAVAPETMRKITKGYSPASEVLMQSFRHILKLEMIARGGKGSDVAIFLREHGGPFWGAGEEAPIISEAQAGNAHDYIDAGGEVERIRTPCKDPHTYVLRLSGDSMEPKFFKGDLLVVSPSREAMNGDFVIAKVKQTEEVMFKLYHEDGKQRERVRLTSFNQAYPPFEFHKKELVFTHPVHDLIRVFRKDK